ADEQHVVARQQREVHLRDDRMLVADDARKEFVAALQGGEKIVVNLLLDRLRPPAAVAKFAQRFRPSGGSSHAVPIKPGATHRPSRAKAGRVWSGAPTPTSAAAVAAAPRRARL